MTILVESYLPLPAGEAWQLVKRSQTLIFVTRGIIGFRSGDFPVIWQQGQMISTRLYAFGLIPLWKHSLKFERIDLIDTRILQDWAHKSRYLDCLLQVD